MGQLPGGLCVDDEILLDVSVFKWGLCFCLRWAYMHLVGLASKGRAVCPCAGGLLN